MNDPTRCAIALPSSNDLNAAAQLVERLGGKVLRFATKGGSEASSSSASATTRLTADRLNPDKSPTDNANLALEGWLEPLVNDIDDVIVLSPQGIRLLMELANQLHRETQLMRALAGVRRIAYGVRPAAALSELGLPADITAQHPSVASLSKELEHVDLSGRAVGLIPRASDPKLLDLIASKGGLPRILAPFEDTAVSPVSSLVESLLSALVQVLVFSSPEQVRDVWRSGSLQHSVDELRRAFSTTHVIAVGLTTARALEQVGVANTIVSSSELACASPNQIADLFALGLPKFPSLKARTGT